MIDLLGIIGAAIVAVVGAWLAGQRNGRAKERKDAIHEAMQDERARIKAGRQAVRDGRASGDDPADRLRRNDQHW